MEAIISSPCRQYVVTIEDDSMLRQVGQAIRMIRGVRSVRLSSARNNNTITPELQARLETSRKDIAEGRGTTCRSKAELHSFLATL